ncbi:MAG: cytochrome c biogenesis protein CcsA [Planctomycetota bacterium]|nr:cytochrome c biogenesis protein CcsA [Planctomycetota bacterium]
MAGYIHYLGAGLLAVNFILCGLAVFVGISALKKEPQAAKKILLLGGRRAIFSAMAISIASFVLLIAAFIGDDFSVAAVTQYSSTKLPFLYKLSAAWTCSAGSLLLWSVCTFICFTMWLISPGTSKNIRFNNIALSVGSAVCLGFSALLLFSARPFASSSAAVNNGTGLNPLLQNLWNIVHPPILFIGYSAFLIPFVIIITAVFADVINETAIYKQLRRWLLFGICFLTLGIATGARWSYIELGWGGYWAWDPVENMSLLPWLAAVAALHCLTGVSITDKFRFWAVVLMPVPFVLCLVATFVTRSGILQSLHSFGQSESYPVLLVFIGCCFLAWLICVIRSAKIITVRPSEPNTLILKKRNMLFWMIIIFVFTAAVIGVATLWPIISPAFAGSNFKTVLTRDFYDRVVSIVGILAAFLVGLAAVADFQRRSGFILKSASCCGIGLVCAYIVYKNGNNTPLLSLACGICTFSFFAILIAPWDSSNGIGKIGSNISHLGLLLLVVAAGFSSKELTAQTQLDKGKIMILGDKYEFVYDSFKQQSADGINQAGPEIIVKKDGLPKKLWPHNNVYPNGQNTSESAVYTNLFEDVYIVFDGITEHGSIIIDVKLKPMMLWLWISLLLITAGTAMAIFGGRKKSICNEVVFE